MDGKKSKPIGLLDDAGTDTVINRMYEQIAPQWADLFGVSIDRLNQWYPDASWRRDIVMDHLMARPSYPDHLPQSIPLLPFTRPTDKDEPHESGGDDDWYKQLLPYRRMKGLLDDDLSI